MPLRRKRLPHCIALGLVFLGCGGGDASRVTDTTVGVSAAAEAPAMAAMPGTDSTVARDTTSLPGPRGPRLMEGYPLDLMARLEARDTGIVAGVLGSPDSVTFKKVQGIIDRARRWKPGKPVRVAFNGGSQELRALIAGVANEWSRHSGVPLDFHTDASRARFREWKAGDLVYSGDIRIAFQSGRDGGYWSLVGSSSVDPKVVRAGQASMNFDGFDAQPPADWQAVVLHEFGHALGFLHDHQHPFSACETDFRWDDDPGYVLTRDARRGNAFARDLNGRRPGIYTMLGGPPNNWDRARVDYNMRRLAFDDEMMGAFDPSSIMKYYFEPDYFRNGSASSCYSRHNSELSTGDQRMAALAYAVASGTPEARERDVVAAVGRGVDSLALTTSVRESLKREILKVRSVQKMDR